MRDHTCAWCKQTNIFAYIIYAESVYIHACIDNDKIIRSVVCGALATAARVTKGVATVLDLVDDDCVL